jgi:hypothetical protein
MNRAPLLSTCIALGIGVVIAAVVACGGASKSAAPVMKAYPGSAEIPGGRHDARIEQLDAQITADYAKLDLGPREPAAAGVCVVNCDPAMQPQAVDPRPSDDPACKKSEAATCKDHCALGDSICDSAAKICKIAGELGNDAWANGKCNDGEASCKKSREKCCGCE